MNPQIPTEEYRLLVRGTHRSSDRSPAGLQWVMIDLFAWVERFTQRGVNRGAQPLVEEGKLITGAKGTSVTVGAFAQSKEAIVGYFRPGMASMDEAVRLAQACPFLA